MLAFKGVCGLSRVLIFLVFSFTSFWNLWANEQRKAYDSKGMNCPKKALFIFAGYESNGRDCFALSHHIDLFNDLEKNDFSVSLRYAKTYEEAKKIKSNLLHKSIDILVYGGHGNYTCINFGKSKLIAGLVNKEDFKLMKKSGYIVSYSCGTGDVRETDSCIAQGISVNSGFPVFAPMDSATDLQFIQTATGMFPRFNKEKLCVPTLLFNGKKVQCPDEFSAVQKEIILYDLKLIDLIDDSWENAISFLNKGDFSDNGLSLAIVRAIRMECIPLSLAVLDKGFDVNAVITVELSASRH